jgi:hypothetical protein
MRSERSDGRHDTVAAPFSPALHASKQLTHCVVRPILRAPHLPAALVSFTLPRQDMGFTRPEAERALGLSGGSLSGAVQLLTR